MSYPAEQVGILEDEAKSILEAVGYSLSFRTTHVGRQMTAVFRVIKWTFAVHNGRYLKSEIDEAVADVRRAYRGKSTDKA